MSWKKFNTNPLSFNIYTYVSIILNTENVRTRGLLTDGEYHAEVEMGRIHFAECVQTNG